MSLLRITFVLSACSQSRVFCGRMVTNALLSVLFACGLASSISAQPFWAPAQFVPTHPTAIDQIRADFDVPQAPNSNSTSIVGALVRTDVFLGPGVIGPPPVIVPYNAFFGPLPPNAYTYEIYLHYQDGTIELRSSQFLVVVAAPVPVPTFSSVTVLLLSTALLSAGALAIQRE
jgi:hypothetical protein